MTAQTGFPDLDQIAERIDRVSSLDQKQLEAEEVALLGRKSGALTLKAKSLGSLPLEQRKTYGAKVNELKLLADAVIVARKKELQVSTSGVLARGIDLSMPGRRRWVGAEHPVTRVVDESSTSASQLMVVGCTRGPERSTEQTRATTSRSENGLVM